MMGDAGNHPAFNAITTNRPQDLTRLQNALDHLKNYNVKHTVFRRRAAEDFRIILTSRPAMTEDFKDDIMDVFCKVLKKPKEDISIVEQILWTLTNLSHANSPLIHDLLPKGIVKLIAFHAKNSTTPAVRDQAIMCLGNLASDCAKCRYCVIKTNIFDTLLDILQTPTTLSASQRDHYAWTLQNIIRPSSTNIELSPQDREKLLKVVVALVTLPPPDESIRQGVEILHDWILVDDDKSSGVAVVRNATLMTLLLQLFNADKDEVSSKVIRTIGNIAFNDDDIIQDIIDYGFVAVMDARLQSSGSTLEADIIWCLSNILGSLRPTCVHAIYDRAELLQYLIQNCYSYDPRLRRESIFCVINICTFFKGDEQRELYLLFFGRLIMDTLDGFTVEEDATMAQAVEGILAHVIEEMKLGNPIYKELIEEYGFEEAVRRRFQWTQKVMENFDAGTSARKELYKLLNLCADVLNLINQKYKAVPKRATQGSNSALSKKEVLNPLVSTPSRPQSSHHLVMDFLVNKVLQFLTLQFLIFRRLQKKMFDFACSFFTDYYYYIELDVISFDFF